MVTAEKWLSQKEHRAKAESARSIRKGTLSPSTRMATAILCPSDEPRKERLSAPGGGLHEPSFVKSDDSDQPPVQNLARNPTMRNRQQSSQPSKLTSEKTLRNQSNLDTKGHETLASQKRPVWLQRRSLNLFQAATSKKCFMSPSPAPEYPGCRRSPVSSDVPAGFCSSKSFQGQSRFFPPGLPASHQ